MGLLDEAIRDHLDLKRRRGADPAEIERAEREALGPVRREPLGGEEAPLDTAQVISSEPPPLDLEGSSGRERYAVQESGGPHDPDEELDDDEDEDGVDEEEWDDDYEDEEEEPSLAAAPTPMPAPEEPRTEEHRQDRPRGGDEAPGETVAYDIEPGHPGDPPASESHGSEEDVLEETPEFLQDTPDHDRLWFEQKPPRDFDFEE